MSPKHILAIPKLQPLVSIKATTTDCSCAAPTATVLLPIVHDVFVYKENVVTSESHPVAISVASVADAFKRTRSAQGRKAGRRGGPEVVEREPKLCQEGCEVVLSAPFMTKGAFPARLRTRFLSLFVFSDNGR